jgi:hypothetical protein
MVNSHGNVWSIQFESDLTWTERTCPRFLSATMASSGVSPSATRAASEELPSSRLSKGEYLYFNLDDNYTSKLCSLQKELRGDIKDLHKMAKARHTTDYARQSLFDVINDFQHTITTVENAINLELPTERLCDKVLDFHRNRQKHIHSCVDIDQNSVEAKLNAAYLEELRMIYDNTELDSLVADECQENYEVALVQLNRGGEQVERKSSGTRPALSRPSSPHMYTYLSGLLRAMRFHDIQMLHNIYQELKDANPDAARYISLQ